MHYYLADRLYPTFLCVNDDEAKIAAVPVDVSAPALTSDLKSPPTNPQPAPIQPLHFIVAADNPVPGVTMCYNLTLHNNCT